MNNNTSNYQEYTFSKLLEQYDKILVPMIQRDYAQGRTDKKATDVRNNLLNDIFSGKDVHFDLVFGSKEKRIIDGKEMNCFIPVDGQQRLTTLFLLFLYGLKAGKTNIELDLSIFSYDTRRAASDFCNSITSEEWFVPNDKKVSDVIKDSSWFMNYWEKDPTVEGMLNMLDAIHEKCKIITDYPNLNKVTFFFFDLESNGLNENLYLKMNSRGKPLTAFENLKAKIEKVLPDTNKVDMKWFPENNAAPKDSFKEKWKFFMDRDWTNAFWDEEHPENYDESITKFIVRFLAGYWAAYGTDEEQMANDLKSLNSKDSYADFIPFEPVKKVLELKNAFPSLAYALTIAPTIKPYWPNDTIKVSDKSEYKFLAVIFTYVLFKGDGDAMRFAWNMAENYVSEYDNFVTYCKRAGEIHKFMHDNNVTSLYKCLSDIEFGGNISDQLKEEIAKAKQIINGGDEWKSKIIAAEKYAFFKGAIRFLFTDGKGNIKWCDFDTKWTNANKYFDENGVKNEYNSNALLLRYYISFFKEWWMFWNFEYNGKDSTWKDLLTSKRHVPNHNLLLEAPNDQVFILFSSTLDKYDEEFKERQENVHNELVNTNIIQKTTEWNVRLNWRYNNYCLYPYNTRAPWKIYVIANPRNNILSELYNDNKITTNQKIDGCQFFWGWDINFRYEDHDFQWTTHSNVYLMEKGERRSSFKPNDKIDCTGFIEKLNELISQANSEQSSNYSDSFSIDEVNE